MKWWVRFKCPHMESFFPWERTEMYGKKFIKPKSTPVEKKYKSKKKSNEKNQKKHGKLFNNELEKISVSCYPSFHNPLA